jgi:hypothetical protein
MLMNTVLAIAAVTALTLVNVDRVWVAPLLAQDRVATLIAQVRTALGGEQKLAAVKSISAEGAFRRAMGSRSVEGNIALLLVRPDKLRRSEESKMFGSSSERISTFDGAQAWDETVNAARVGGGGGGGDHDHGGGGGGGGAFAGLGADHNHADQFQGRNPAESTGPGGVLTEEQMNAARIRRMKMELQRWTVAFLADSNQPFTDAGRAESPDGPADVIETKDEADRPVRYFIDPTSHMPLMVQYQEVRAQAMPAQGAPKTTTVTIHLSDYKKVDGVMLPHQVDTSINGQASEAWTIENFKVNPTVKANVFQKKAK